jgi:energy-coupling factor transporter ATP-binding protein EcfA2
MVKREIKLKDVGAIEALTIAVPEPGEGGVIVLRGRNGSGKSTALEAVNALVTGNGDVRTRDGALGAMVEGFGARVHVGRRKSAAGECEVVGLEGPDPSLLVDPGIKDRGAAHAERIRALCKIAGAQVEREPFVKLAGSVDEFERVVKASSLEKGDVPSVAAAVKRDFEAAARAAEAEAGNIQNEANGIASAAQDVPETELLDERALQIELESASAELGELRGRQRNADELRAAAKRARETLDSYGTKGTVDAGKAAEEALAEAKTKSELAVKAADDATERASAARAALRQAEQEEAEAKAEMRAAQTAEKNASAAVEQAFEDFTRRKQLQQAVTAAESAADVDPESIAALEKRQTAARTTLQRAEVVRRAIEQRQRARAKAEQAGEALSRAERLRDAARGCELVITAALAKVCPQGMSVHEGMLVVETDRGLEPFDELSHGERWRWAINISSRAISDRTRGLLTCRQEGWDALDPTTQHEVDRMAREEGLIILTASADDGDLRAEAFQ